MIFFKRTFYLLITFLVVACSSSKKKEDKTEDKTEVKTTINIPNKKLELTEYEKNNWQHLDLATDTIPGMSLHKAYEFLEGKTGNEVIVAVIDTGIDLKHEDLIDVAWVNKKEVEGNGVDDDKNGYIDDINGWNFLGKAYSEHYEYERILKQPSLVDAKKFATIKKEHEQALGSIKGQQSYFEEELQESKKTLKQIEDADKALAKHFEGKKYSKKEIFAIKTNDKNLLKQIEFVRRMTRFDDMSWNNVKEEMKENVTTLIEDAKKNKELLSGEYFKKDFRAVVGDNPYDINDTDYGDNNVFPSNADEIHGSHVAGIIAAKRNNKIGMDGVANNVKIMALRAVPEGDEYDKDIALAIRYAVDNGAKVINASFGKYYSPKKQWVYDAIKYAAQKDVLIVNASGNDSKNIDKEQSFPNDRPNLGDEISNNLITVGASSSNYNEMLVGNFSNYGKENVDIFAPGVGIYATFPNNKYAHESGTSMASPCVAGVAALIRSYYPKLSASQVKDIIIKSGTKINMKVKKPIGFGFIDESSFDQTGDDLVPFSDLCASGSIVNAYNAVRMAKKEVSKTK